MKTELMPIDKLIPYARNPRKNDQAVDKVAASIKEFGFRQPIVVDDENVIVVGHTRWKAAKKLGLIEVPVHVATGLTKAQAKAYRLVDNRTNEEAEWDDDMLRAELEELLSSNYDLGNTGFTEREINDITIGDDNPYTSKIESPIYTPKGEKPTLNELCDTTKTKKLIEEIEEAKIPDDVKAFLRLCAQRHNVFSYEKIAEYYSRAPKEIQLLMENSALVIIDFEKAIEKGFVDMTLEIAGLVGVASDQQTS